MDEYFDVLDKEGKMTGIKKLRREVHRDGDWHKTIHIWIINETGDILLQRRCANKDSHSNMLDISCAGHLTSGDDSLTGVLRELKEELNLDVTKNELKFIKTLTKSERISDSFIDNEFNDLYFLETNKKIEDMKYQKEEISEIIYVPYKEFKKMVNSYNKELLRHDEEFNIIFNTYDSKFDN